MKWSLKIATVAGTEVRIHFTFFILLLLVALQGMGGGHGASGAIEAILFVSSAFLCVLLHEFGHVFAARGYGIRTPDITLLPIGGVARLERMPRKPTHELVVAVCGPLVNVAIAAAIWLAIGIKGVLKPDLEFAQTGHFWENLMKWNLIMVVFNMVPAFPMDGGRVLRAFLAMFTDYGRATRWAATIGQGIALSVALWMILSGHFHPILMIIAFFIFMAAGQEAAAVTQDEATHGLRVRDAMMTEFHTLPQHATLRDAVDLLLSGSQQDFPMLDAGGNLLGVLSRNRLVSALSEHGPLHPAEEVLEICPDSVTSAVSLSEGLERLRATSCPMMPVVDANTGRLIGLLTAENVGEVLMIRAALRNRH
ncbi:Zn-dependent protease (includes SpoIVFB) [Prosthecobacter debontii]|uniref:Zinc metalloprotease n=1 Tax=Prosthecobacter debontii TaxID=48467 RepID=A0A1T4WMU1_9BACT|nr:site-2 protease family protein [Prosthecobacter debontii]SKA77941.1 Zn-dependent protease (includes SpoIVFB) [Prosthecobacter debontii]